MILLFGMKTFRWGSGRSDSVRTCPSSCPNCSFYGYVERKKTIRAVTLFFVIPILPLSGVKTVNICPNCHVEYVQVGPQ